MPTNLRTLLVALRQTRHTYLTISWTCMTFYMTYFMNFYGLYDIHSCMTSCLHDVRLTNTTYDVDFQNNNFEKNLRDRYSSPILPSVWTSCWPEAHGLILGGEGALYSHCLVSVLSSPKVSFHIFQKP